MLRDALAKLDSDPKRVRDHLASAKGVLGAILAEGALDTAAGGERASAAREAETLLRDAHDIRRDYQAADAPQVAELECSLGLALFAQDRASEALPILEAAYPIYEAWGQADAVFAARARAAIEKLAQR